MKIILVGKYNSSEILNGPEKVAKRMLQHISAIYKNTVFLEYYFQYPNNFKYYFLKIFGYKCISSEKKVLRLGIIPLTLYLIINQPAIIHLVTEERFMSAIFAIKSLLKGKIITNLHGILHYEVQNSKHLRKGIYKDLLLESLIFKRSDVLIAYSDILIKTASQYYSKSQMSHAVRLHLGIDENFYQSNNPDMKVLKMVFYNGPDLLIDRGLLELIPVIEEGSKNYKIDVILYVIQALANINHKSQKINIIYTDLMNSTELAIFLRNKHVLIKADKVDTFPQIVLEGMASGLVPILSSKVGTAELIENGSNGFIYDQYEELKTILQKKIFLTNFCEMSAAAKKKAEEFRWEKIINEYLTLYKNQLEKK